MFIFIIPFTLIFLTLLYLTWPKDTAPILLPPQHEIVLLVTAHPDDETMFFSPLLTHLARVNVECHLLCLSSGGYHGQAAARRRELICASHRLGIPPDRVVLLDLPDLPDHPCIKWPLDLVGDVVAKTISDRGIDTVVTFDGRGVSGHSNHKDIYEAVISNLHLPGLKGKNVYALKSFGVLTKYSGVFGAVVQCVINRGGLCVLCDVYQYIDSVRAMAEHHSQLLWFRKLYILSSIYMWFNKLEKISR